MFSSNDVDTDTWTSSWEAASSWQPTFLPSSSWEGGWAILIILGGCWWIFFIILGGWVTGWVAWLKVFLHQVGSKASLVHLSGHQVAWIKKNGNCRLELRLYVCKNHIILMPLLIGRFLYLKNWFLQLLHGFKLFHFLHWFRNGFCFPSRVIFTATSSHPNVHLHCKS